MIFKFFFSIIAIVLFLCVAGILYFVWMVRKTKQQIDEAGQRFERERRRQQGQTDGVRMEGNSQKKSHNQKIFADDEGEYVDFEEEE
ncbi:MAG: DUF4834 family protein [Prevotella sp.]|nr:DUF4834 family protein [Prevotella sp.]